MIVRKHQTTPSVCQLKEKRLHVLLQALQLLFEAIHITQFTIGLCYLFAVYLLATPRFLCWHTDVSSL